MIHTLDTHILIWYFIGSKRLNPKIRETIDDVRNKGGRLLVPTIVLAEALAIAEKGKVRFLLQPNYSDLSRCFSSLSYITKPSVITLRINE